MEIFQYVAIVAAFFLPWTVGIMVTSKKSGNNSRFRLMAFLCAVIVILLSSSVALSFILQR